MELWATPFFLLLLLPENSMGTPDSAMYRLRKQLLANYDPTLPPVKEHQTVVNISVEVLIFNFHGLDVVRQIMTCGGWIRLRWKDEHIHWDPNEYEGIKNLSLKLEEIWHPDITIFNSWPMKDVDSMTMAYVGVFPSGNVWWTLSGTYTTLCEVDFASTIQKCNIILGSWDYDGLMMDFTPPDAGSIKVHPWNTKHGNPEWKIDEAKIERKVYHTGDAWFPELIAELTISRQQQNDSLAALPWVLSALAIVPLALPPRLDVRPLPSLFALVVSLFLTVRAAEKTPGNFDQVAFAVSEINPPLALVLVVFLYTLIPSCLSVYRGDTRVPRFLNPILQWYPCPEQESEEGSKDWYKLACILNHVGLVIFGAAISVQIATSL